MMGHAKQMEAEAEQLAAVQSELERSVASTGSGIYFIDLRAYFNFIIGG